MNENYYGRRSELLQFVPRKIGDVLDVGCGTGDFFDALKSSAFEITSLTGIEPLAEVAAIAKSRHTDACIFEGYFDEIVLDQKFDTIFFNDSLEHMVDPYTTIDRARQMLKPQGKIICSIPNFLYAPSVAKILLTRDFEYRQSGIMDKTHLRFFTRKSAERLVKMAGLKIKMVAGINDYIRRPWKIRQAIPLAILAVTAPLLFGLDSRYMQILVIAENT